MVQPGCDHEEEHHHDDLVRTQARDLRRHRRDDGGGRGSARERGPRPLRDLRPHLPRAVRAPLQLRAHVGPPRRLDLVGALHGRGPLRERRLRHRRPRPCRRRHRLLRRRPQGHGPLRPVGPARRGDARRASRAPAGRREAAPAPRGPARLPSQPDHLDAALHGVARQGARRAPDAGDAVREALDRRLRRGRGELARSGLRGGRLLRRGRPPRTHLRGRGRPHARPRGRSARRGRHGLARQRHPAPRLEPGLDRLRPRLPRRRHARRLRAVGSQGALLPARLERRLRARRSRLPADRRRAAARPGDRQRPADGGRLPHAQGLEVRHRGQGLARRRPQAVLRRVLRGAGRADRRRQAVAAGLRGRGPALPRGRRQRDHGGLLLGGPAGHPRQGRGERATWPRRWPTAWRRPASGSIVWRARRARARRAWRRSTRSRAARRPRSPRSCASRAGAATTLRDELGRALHHLNAASGGAILTAAADLLGSTSVNAIGAGFADGFWNWKTNPDARLLSIGGICEDAITGVLSGIAAYGHAIGVGSSYGAFMAPLGHIAARLHAIGAQARAVGHRRALQADLPRLRPRRPEDRRGRPDARRPAGAAAPAGELPAGDDDHADAVGAAGDLAAGRGRPGAAAGAHRALRDAAQRDRARPRRRSASRPPRTPTAASTCCAGRRTRPTSRSCCRRAP